MQANPVSLCFSIPHFGSPKEIIFISGFSVYTLSSLFRGKSIGIVFTLQL